MNLSILQHYNGPNINKNTLFFFTYLSQKNLLRADLKLIITLQRIKKVFKKVDTNNHWHPRHEIIPKNGG